MMTFVMRMVLRTTQLKVHDSASEAPESPPLAAVCTEVNEAVDALLNSVCEEFEHVDSASAVDSACERHDGPGSESCDNSAGNATPAALLTPRYGQVRPCVAILCMFVVE